METILNEINRDQEKVYGFALNIFFLSFLAGVGVPKKELKAVNIYLRKFNNRNVRERCGICSNLTIKTPEQ